MMVEDIVACVANSCSEAKGKDIAILDLSKISDMATHFVIVSARSDRQAQGICNRIINDLESIGLEPFAIEGLESGQWVLLDLGEVLVHIFYEPLREYYDLEGLWAKAKRISLPDLRVAA